MDRRAARLPDAVSIGRATWRAEWRLAARDRSLLLTTLIVALLTAAGVAGGVGWVRFQRAAIADLREAAEVQHATYKRDALRYAATHDRIELDAPQHPVSAYWKRAYAWRAPSPGAVLRIGQSDVFPYYSVFHGVEEQVLHYAAEIRNPLHLLIGKLDASFVAIYVLPLLMIVLTYDNVSAERESGRLAIVRAQGTSLSSWVASRLLFRWALILGVFLASLITALAALEPPVLATPALLQFVVLVALYLAFWCGLALFVNARGYSSAVNALALVAAWIVVVFACPTALDRTAAAAHPAPSRNHQALEDARVRAEVDAARPEHLERYLRARPELRVQAPIEKRPSRSLDWYPAFVTYQLAVHDRTAGTAQAIRDALVAREQLVTRLRFGSPAIALHAGFERLAGVSVADAVDYQERVERFRDAWRTSVRGFIFRNEFLDVEDFDRLPTFEAFAPPPVGGRWTSFLIDAIWLGGLAGALVLAAVRRLSARSARS